MIKVRRRLFHFTIISLTILINKKEEEKENPVGQTYSWNKVGLKLLLFQWD